MDNQTELVKQLYSDHNELQPKSLPNSVTDRRLVVMVALWKRMFEYFGQSWVREYGDADGGAIKSWTDALAAYSEDQIARGVKNCREWTGNFVPNVAQFGRLCLTVRPEEKPNVTEKRMARERETGKPVAVLEHLARSAHSDIAKQELARMVRVMSSPKTREPSDGDVESFETSYHKCGLGQRWPGAV